MSKKKIFIIAGEVSGDLHASRLVKELKAQAPSLSFEGLGGKRMEESGVELIANIVDFAAVGIIESISNIWPLLKIKKELEKIFSLSPPSLLILIDYSGFNLKIAALAKKYGIKVVYYIAPQIWAWRKYRIKEIKKYIDEVIAVFPFEVEMYQKAGVKVSYFGHPLVDIVKTYLSEEEWKERVGIKEGCPIVTFLPGSRRKEISFVFPELITLARKLRKRYPGINLVLGIAPGKEEIYREEYPEVEKLFLKERDFIYDAISNSDLVITASGTATLETALLGKPMIVVYRVSALTGFILKFLIKVDKIALANIVAGERIVPEFVQDNLKTSKIFPTVVELLERKDIRENISHKLKLGVEKLGTVGVISKIASRILEIINEIK